MLDRLVSWAEEDEDVRALILTGSHAAKYPSDELSDYDVGLFVANPDKYANDAWQEDIGEVWHCFKLPEARWRATIFAPGTRFDISIRSVDELDQFVTDDPPAGINDYILGYRVLLDKDGRTAGMAPPFSRPLVYDKPDEATFKQTVDEFWHEAHNVAKYLARGDLWCVKHREWNTKRALLPMLEWHAHAKHGWEYNTAAIGKRMRSWIDPEIWDELRGAFPGFDVEEGWRALFVTIGLFRRVTSETAELLHFQYPDDMFMNMESLVRSMRDQNHPAQAGSDTSEP